MEHHTIETLQHIQARGLGRRAFLKTLAALASTAGVALVTQGCSPAAGSSGPGGKLDLCVWQGYDDAEVGKPFLDRYNVEVAASYISSNEECFTKERAAPGSFDVIGINMTYAEALRQANLIVPVDRDVVTNWPNLIEALRNQPFINHDGVPYLVPYIWGTVGVNYNPEFLTIPEQFDFRDLAFDDRYRGKIVVTDDPAGMMILLGIMNGFEHPTRISSAQLQQNVDLGLQLKERLLTIAATFTDVTDILVRGDAWINLIGWEAVTKWAHDAGASLSYAYPRHSWTWCDGWMVTANSDNPQTAWAYINQMTGPEAMAALAANLFSAPANKEAYPLLAEDVAQMFSLSKLEPALQTAPVLPIPPNESDEFSTMSDWQSAWEQIKAA